MRSKFDVFCIYKKENVKRKGVGVVRFERAEIKTDFFTNKLIYQQYFMKRYQSYCVLHCSSFYVQSTSSYFE